MRVKLDENLPESLVDIFKQHGHEAITVTKEGLSGTQDNPLFEIAKSEGRLFVTLDLHFSDIRAYQPGSHNGIIVIRSRSKGRNTVNKIIQSLLQEVNIETFAGALAIVGEKRIRVRRGNI